MRSIFTPLLAAFLVAAAPAAGAASDVAPGPRGAAKPTVPDLQILRNFRAGTWVMTHHRGQVHRIPLSDGSMLLTGRRLRAQCAFVVVSDTPEEAIVTYRCPNGPSGRTVVRRETASFYVVRAQGIVNNTPFAHRVEWRLATPAERSSLTKN